MIKYAKVINNETGLVEIGAGTNTAFYKSIGMTQQDVRQSDIDWQWYLTDKCPMKTQEQIQQEEAERIALLHLTAADVERAIYKVKGIDFEDIIAQLEVMPLAEGQEPLVDIKALKIELKANNFYRGNPYVNVIGGFLGFTTEQLDEFFETGDYTKLYAAQTIETDNADSGDNTISDCLETAEQENMESEDIDE